eukprot:TRINITY_DN349_c0_g1_i3.p1 TRINITY_DN349_c0_g1~~TRINITY_DN349_c0_g1_i3.p1  ORF type:complete len:131 (+),score=16.09 TRINITY_DN349_c0_g1_i3:63-455(+)
MSRNRSRSLTPLPESNSLHEFPDELHRKVDPKLSRALEVVKAQNKKKLIRRIANKGSSKDALAKKLVSVNEPSLLSVEIMDPDEELFNNSPRKPSPPSETTVYAIHKGANIVAAPRLTLDLDNLDQDSPP